MTDDVQCARCGGWCCQGCLTQEDLDKLNCDMLQRAQGRLVSPIVSKPYLVRPKTTRGVPIDMSPHVKYSLEEFRKLDVREAMERGGEELANRDGYTIKENVSLMENIKDINSTACFWDDRPSNFKIEDFDLPKGFGIDIDEADSGGLEMRAYEDLPNVSVPLGDKDG